MNSTTAEDPMRNAPTPPTTLRLAVIGAGPAGLALALQAARSLPQAEITLFDARQAEHDLSGDARTLALSLGSIQFLQRLQAWPAAQAQPILSVHVSQAPPTLGEAAVFLTAAEQAVPLLGAVIAYGPLVAEMQRVWLAAAQAEPLRLHSRFGHAVAGMKDLTGGVEVDAGVAETFDLAVVAEGGVFADQARKAVTHDYGQTAWVGSVTLEDATPGAAFERFTRHGPAALLPLKPGADGRARAALVWCVSAGDDLVRALDDAQRVAVLNATFPREAGRIVAVSALKAFALGLNAERTLVAGRRVRIGNAAQTLHPVAGQGLNLGLRDVFALAHALRMHGDVERALRRVQWQRVPDRWSTIATTDFLARAFTWQWPGAGALRGLALAGLQAAGPLKSALARQMMFGRR
jgi:2-octaprenyl-6-methoxyphenol hydroxylase